MLRQDPIANVDVKLHLPPRVGQCYTCDSRHLDLSCGLINSSLLYDHNDKKNVEGRLIQHALLLHEYIQKEAKMDFLFDHFANLTAIG